MSGVEKIVLEDTESVERNIPAASGWILYTRQESIRNRHYIDLYRKAGEKYGMAVTLGIYQPDNCRGQTGIYWLKQWISQVKPAFVINRTRDYLLAKDFEALGVPVYNHSFVAELGNDKAKAYRFMQKRGIPMMPTFYGLQTPKQFPVIVKTSGGHGGTEVFYIPDRYKWQEWKQEQYKQGQEYVVQQPASDLGRDLRVYIVGNQITAAVLRTSGSDFRSNYCLGGKEEMYELSDAQRKLVESVAAPLDIGMAGIDFVFHYGHLMFNEIEDMAGARGLYELSDYDIAQDYIGYIDKEMRKGAAYGRFI